ncbi:MAG: class I SAM-dependent methyltransferase [Haliea sp.]
MYRLKDMVKYAIGSVAERVNPGIAADIDAARNTDKAVKIKHFILFARLQKAKTSGDEEAVERALAAFWKGNSGDIFHRQHTNIRFNLFREKHYSVIEALTELLEEKKGQFHRLIEIGCGDGRALVHCFKELPGITTAIGLDINAAIIEQISEEFKNIEGLSFAEADGTEWLAAHPGGGTVLFANAGVLEYFSPENFDKLLSTLAAYSPAAIALVEPASPDHDLENDTESRVFGYENSFSHNHRYRLAAAGFDILHARDLVIGSTRWILMLGLHRGDR